ncbi:PREDICTED: LRR receptor-like serine/threonine-protein kinase FLS2 [Fragaria vesca subsp. vesca]|uniref:LRR receptor-like serine/threonine-protein kinase FLS2 n=1 Tax=Fragaria vesca subsp. vesca TaxID=101020 RepID=UPI0002C3630A|nr:PREDICTED: LRR receptor-like serine/threonine-protein kinase FLS2 [Fragaria vesca subsp. vesca]
MASRKSSFKLLLPVFLLLLTAYSTFPEAKLANSGVKGFRVACNEEERAALLKFRQGLKDPYGRLSSWVGEDCCNWTGIGCSNQIGNVLKLDLSNPNYYVEKPTAATGYMRACLGGELDPSLLSLTYLNYLDLSCNNFQGIAIPSFLGSLKKLRYLDLSQSSFGGMVPPQLGNLSNLFYLDLSHLTTYSYPQNPWVSDFYWLSSLSSLQYLSLGNLNLSLATTNWLPAVNMLPSLLELHLPDCELRNLPQSIPFVNFTSLQVLELSHNHFNTSLPQWLFNISTLVTVVLSHSKFTGSTPQISWKNNHCSLQTLDLSYNSVSMEIQELIEGLSRCSNSSLKLLDVKYNNVRGLLPDSLGSLQYLETLRISQNALFGPLPTTIGNLSHLQVLDLAFNMMNGTIPKSIGQLAQLNSLDLWGSSWEGIISEIHFSNLSLLTDLSLSSTNNSLVFHFSHEWIPPFPLYSLSISDCKLMNPRFPTWLRNQSFLNEITLSTVGISDTIPDWFWGKSPYPYWWSNVDLSNNQLRGQLPKLVNFAEEASVNLNSNSLEGSLPFWPNVIELALASNRFSGPIPLNIGQEMPNMNILDLSRNNLNGSIPSSISKMKSLSSLDLSRNYLSGNIPSDWKGLQSLTTIDFSNNNLFGQIPSSMCSQLPSLSWLRLSNNNLSGEIALSLRNCTNLYTLDLGGNKFSGTIPTWIGDDLHLFSYLLLGANMFTGNIPQQICGLPDVHVLNLSQNILSGSIPRCLGNLEQMKHRVYLFKPWPLTTFMNTPFLDLQHMDLKVKRLAYEYTNKLLPLINSIDLSSNNLSGEIPEEITNLTYLGSLILSRNQLTGKIPQGFGSLDKLETLDLSVNHLRGPIPISMTSMTALNNLNLSYNNLSGPIPSTNQFHTFIDPAIYEGNSRLCGPPLPTPCSTSNNEDPQPKEDAVEDEDESGKIWFYVSTALGFKVGFWAVFGSLVIKRPWRHAYFQFLDKLKVRLLLVTTGN